MEITIFFILLMKTKGFVGKAFNANLFEDICVMPCQHMVYLRVSEAAEVAVFLSLYQLCEMSLRTLTNGFFHCPSTNQPFVSVYRKAKIQPSESGGSFMNSVPVWEGSFGSAF